jgi:hypothetical protein
VTPAPPRHLRSPPLALNQVWYLAVNSTDTMCEWMGKSDMLPILAASTVANSSLPAPYAAKIVLLWQNGRFFVPLGARYRSVRYGHFLGVILVLVGPPESAYIARNSPLKSEANGRGTQACIAKDSAFAKLFGTIAAPVPMASYGLWFTRDILSMAFIVTLPPIITPQIQRASEHLGWEISPGAVESRSLPTIRSSSSPLSSAPAT